MDFPRNPILVAVLLAPCGACAHTIEDVEFRRIESRSLPPASTSRLGLLFARPEGIDLSFFTPLDRSDEGLDVRLALAATAENSIDAQSYLWHEDAAGSLLLDKLLEAADRGIRVRLLIDGFQLEGRERLDQALDSHGRLEIRVFNPALHQPGLWRDLEIVEHLERFDHRMHNKLFLVDGVAAVFGGRNIGDEYFGLGDTVNFRDFDLLAAGPVVGELSLSFDAFWNSSWTVSLRDLDAHEDPDSGQTEAHDEARARLRALHMDDARLDARRAFAHEDWLAALERALPRMHAGRAHVIHDSQEIERSGATGLMGRAWEQVFAASEGDVLLVTAYLVPDETLLQNIRTHVSQGGRVQILTNSFRSTNQPLAHAGCQSSRRDLLEAGAELHELRADAWSHIHHRSPGSAATRLGLHTKSAVFGETRVLVGSMNLDPRSMELNTELGVAIDSRALAREVRTCLERELAPSNSWRVTLEPGGRLCWTTAGRRQYREPIPTVWARFKQWTLSLLPLRGEV